MKSTNIKKEDVEMGSIQGKITALEKKTTKSSEPSKRKCPLAQAAVHRALQSRFIGFLLGPLFGLFIYYYVTYLILDCPPFTREIEIGNSTNLTDFLDVSRQAAEKAALFEETLRGGIPKKAVAKTEDIPGLPSEVPVEVDNTLAQVVGGSIGGGTGALLAGGSLVSRRVRCSMLLMIPSLTARRGRAFMISAAAGFLLAGPLGTIDANIQQVVHSFTCLYENAKEIGEQYIEEFKRIWESLRGIFEQVNTLVNAYQEEMEKLAKKATAEARREVEASQRKVKEQTDKLKKEMKKLKKVIEAPSNVAGKVCGAGKSALSWTKDTAGGAWRDVKSGLGSVFGKRRRKRNACGIKAIVPDIDISKPDISLDAMKDFLKKMNPNINLVDMDLRNVFNELEHNSIADIRERLKTILVSVFEILRTYSGYASKIFYLSILLIVWDSYAYMQKYYSDDSFDNMFVDDNLRKLWWHGGKEKILPLRNWELNMKFQYTTAVKLSKPELKRILIQSIPTIVFAVVAVSVLTFDVALSSILQVFKDNAQFGIAYEGMEAGIDFQSLVPGIEAGKLDPALLNLRGFNLSTEPCLPTPQITPQHDTAIICVLVIVSLLSCILDAFASRLRARICNIVFSDRAAERAEYLYKRIVVGRGARRIQFNMVIRRELDIEDRKEQFCGCWSSLAKILSKKMKKTQTCPGCQKTFKKENAKYYAVTHKKNKRDVPICKDCYKDIGK